jgi:hypothetical protein
VPPATSLDCPEVIHRFSTANLRLATIPVVTFQGRAEAVDRKGQSMSVSRIDRALHYRERAVQLRAVAEAALLAESRGILARIADDYETIATLIEAGEAGRKSAAQSTFPDKPSSAIRQPSHPDGRSAA